MKDQVNLANLTTKQLERYILLPSFIFEMKSITFSFSLPLLNVTSYLNRHLVSFIFEMKSMTYSFSLHLSWSDIIFGSILPFIVGKVCFMAEFYFWNEINNLFFLFVPFFNLTEYVLWLNFIFEMKSMTFSFSLIPS